MDYTEESDNFTKLLQQAQSGEADSSVRLEAERRFCDLVNQELRRAAAGVVRGNHHLAQPTSLVNEVFLKLFRKGVCEDLKNRRYFFVVAIDQMRQILRERWRARQSQNAGGHLEQVPLDIALDQYFHDFKSTNKLDFMMLDEALERVKRRRASPRQFEILQLYYFSGQQQGEIAQTLGIDQPLVSKELKAALAKLRLELSGDA